MRRCPFSSTALRSEWPIPTVVASPAVAGKDVIGVESPALRVVVQVPLDAQIS